MNDIYEVRNSIYCYEGTNVLKNKLDIKDLKKLQEKEASITAAKLLILREKGITGAFDKAHIINLHKFIFEDLYYFAGEFRKENIAKGNFRFAEYEYIEEELDKLLEELKNENYLENLSKKDLAKRLSYYMSELNVLHPFREGNGRLIREFIRELALKNNYILNLSKEEPEEILDASIYSIIDTQKLEEKLYNCLEEKENN